MLSSCAQPLNIQAKSIFGVSLGLLAHNHVKVGTQLAVLFQTKSMVRTFSGLTVSLGS
jgi:hypothetical protein